eukprot:comp12606_c0_seq1/m.7640 comp12606_c0_seq1/g.7640  ORF comp12606_c0_seq1/g.7640 comp12606_c0_seq1/m.7640 type:complete len:384 (-) comp12606_c0_seq1:39-1190(-)
MAPLQNQTVPLVPSMGTLGPSLDPIMISPPLTPTFKPNQKIMQTPELYNYLDLIHQACERVYDISTKTPVEFAPKLSKKLNNTVFYKREDKQPVFSFKIRGAYNKMSRLTPEQKAHGVVACSAGNHAQGVALSSRVLGIESVIVMPAATPLMKIEGVENHGQGHARVVLHGDNLAEAMAEARRFEREEGMTFVHPFDDELVIAGQGTIGVEILEQMSTNPPEYIFVPVGGGGLCAGIAAYVKQINPQVKVIGVEPEGAACLTCALEAGERVVLPQVDKFAEGVAVAQVGAENFRVCKALVDEMVLVNTPEICAAMKDVYNDTRTILEGAGAVSVAGMKRYVEKNHLIGARILCVTSGANFDFDKLGFVVAQVTTPATVTSAGR